MNKFIKKYIYIVFLIVGMILGLYRLWYFIGSDIPLGYDSGIYIKIFETYSLFFESFDFSIFPIWMKHEPSLPFFAYLLNLIGINNNFLVSWGIGILSILPGFILFLIFKKDNKKLAILSAILYRISITQYQLFGLNYFKQILGINIMLVMLWSFGKSKNILGSILFLILLLTHRHSAMYSGLILMIFFITHSIISRKIDYKKIIILLSIVSLSLLIYIPMWDSLITDGLNALKTTIGGQGYGGIFFNKNVYVLISLPIIVFSLAGVFLKAKNKIDIWLIGYIIGIIWIGLGLVNFNRTLAFLDIFVIILSAYAIVELVNYRRYLGSIIAIILITYTSYFYIKHITISSIPLISNEEFMSIKGLSTNTPDNSIIMTTNKHYTSWIMGYTQRNWISPGWSDINQWNEQQRNKRWKGNGNIKCKMMDDYKVLNSPIYIWIGSQQNEENINGGTCFKKINTTGDYILLKYIN